jgi:2-phospho-L-lactate/phosphoenolpyruvate guanylyltransferase
MGQARLFEEKKCGASGSLAVIVPMKPLALAKQRLRPALQDRERRALAHDMLTHVLATVSTSQIADLAVLVSADNQVLQLAHEWDFVPLQENEPGYNESTTQAIHWTQTEGVDAVLILPADLPNLQTDDLFSLISLMSNEPQVAIIAPNATETGTNALLLRPPDLIPPSFGPDSFNRHCALARAAGVEPAIYRSPSMACDIDLPTDLDHLPVPAIS